MWFNRVLVNGAISPGQWQDIHLKKKNPEMGSSTSSSDFSP